MVLINQVKFYQIKVKPKWYYFSYLTLMICMIRIKDLINNWHQVKFHKILCIICKKDLVLIIGANLNPIPTTLN